MSNSICISYFQLLLMVNFNMGLNFLYGWLMSPFSIESARSHGGVYSVPTRTAFYGYMVAAMVCHDIWFYHAHRYDLFK